ncbi:MAG: hypothetical protein JXR70_07245 [Spirochaetales bacterium]|nr:hypothetical protein [Spirochaetales bacterium]
MAGLAHLGFGFAAKSLSPKIPLGILLVCPLLLDLIYMALALFGVNEGFWSHSLMMALVYSLVVWAIAFLITKKAKDSAIPGLLVLSHWVLDFITWPMLAVLDDPEGMLFYWDESFRFGLGLYRTIPGVILGEAGITLTGIALYVIWLKKKRRKK